MCVLIKAEAKVTLKKYGPHFWYVRFHFIPNCPSVCVAYSFCWSLSSISPLPTPLLPPWICGTHCDVYPLILLWLGLVSGWWFMFVPKLYICVGCFETVPQGIWKAICLTETASLHQRILPWLLLNSNKPFFKFRRGKEDRERILKKRAAWRELWCVSLVPAYLTGPRFPDIDTGDSMPCDVHFKGNVLWTYFLPTRNASGRKEGRVSPSGNLEWKKFSEFRKHAPWAHLVKILAQVHTAVIFIIFNDWSLLGTDPFNGHRP